MSPDFKNNLTDQEFEELFNDMVQKCKKELINKNKEYAKKGNRFDSFDSAAIEYNTTPLVVWGILFDKHYRAIRSYINKEKEYSNEKIEGRIMDCINYLYLLLGIIKRNENNNNSLNCYSYYNPQEDKENVIKSNVSCIADIIKENTTTSAYGNYTTEGTTTSDINTYSNTATEDDYSNDGYVKQFIDMYKNEIKNNKYNDSDTKCNNSLDINGL